MKYICIEYMNPGDVIKCMEEATELANKAMRLHMEMEMEQQENIRAALKGLHDAVIWRMRNSVGSVWIKLCQVDTKHWPEEVKG